LVSKNLANPKDKEKYLDLKERHYRAFLTKINKSNNNNIVFPTASFPPYKYYIGRGNNSILVRAALKTRYWWSMGDFEGWDEYNFVLKEKDSLKGDHNEDQQSLLSTHATDKECSSSTENLINTPKR